MLSSRKTAFAFTICLIAMSYCFGFQDPDPSKGIESDSYRKKRVKTFNSSGPSRKPGPPATAKPRYYRPIRSKISGPSPLTNVPMRGSELADIGFTLWKFDRVTEGDDPKILKEVHPQTQLPIAARRIESASLLSVGDVVRIGIESGSHAGHLYVINREKYSDGTFGKPRLLFPTLGGPGRGKNYVQPGLLMYFPSSQSFFQVDSDTAAKQEAEELIVIVSPTEIVDPSRLKRGPLELTEAEVNDWLKKWSVDVVKMELEDGAGEAMTLAEKAAGDPEKSLSLVPSLTDEDAVPQTLYRMRIKKGNPALARIELKIRPN